jgi:hypothetical protein
VVKQGMGMDLMAGQVGQVPMGERTASGGGGDARVEGNDNVDNPWVSRCCPPYRPCFRLLANPGLFL